MRRILGWLTFLIGLLVPVLALAEDFNVNGTRPTNSPFANLSIYQVVSRLYTITITIMGVVFLILLLVGGVMYLSGAGNEEQTAKARKLLVDAIIGLVLVLAAWGLARFISIKLSGQAVPGQVLDTGGGSLLGSLGGGGLASGGGGGEGGAGSPTCQPAWLPPYLIDHAEAVGSLAVFPNAFPVPTTTCSPSPTPSPTSSYGPSVAVSFAFLDNKSLKNVSGLTFYIYDAQTNELITSGTAGAAGGSGSQADLQLNSGRPINIYVGTPKDAGGQFAYSGSAPQGNGQRLTVFVNTADLSLTKI